MAGNDAKQTLLDYLEDRAFKPVLAARPEDYPESRRPDVEYVRDATRRERDRFHHYPTAADVFANFRDDMSSDEGREVHRQLRDLGLPTLADVRDGFERLARDLGVTEDAR